MHESKRKFYTAAYGCLWETRDNWPFDMWKIMGMSENILKKGVFWKHKDGYVIARKIRTIWS